MGILYENLGINGFLGLFFGQTGNFDQTIQVGRNATFSSGGGFERYGTVTGGLATHPSDNWDSYTTDGTLVSGSTAGGGTAVWQTNHGTLTIDNSEVIPGLGILEADSFNYELDTSLGSDWDLLPVGGNLTDTFTVTAFEGGGPLFFPDLDGDVGNSSDTFTFTFTFVKTVCLARGTKITTIDGDVPIEDLRVGDLVLTMDNDYQPIRWIGSKKVRAYGEFAPVLIKKGTLSNTEDLVVSQAHKMLVSGLACDILFGDRELLAPAIALENGRTILRVEGGMVEYFHILFDKHEIMFANGAPTESMCLSKNTAPSIGGPSRDELLKFFPELGTGKHVQDPMPRRVLRGFESKVYSHQRLV